MRRDSIIPLNCICKGIAVVTTKWNGKTSIGCSNKWKGCNNSGEGVSRVSAIAGWNAAIKMVRMLDYGKFGISKST